MELLWWSALGLALVVTLVVGFLLSLILKEAARIEAGAAHIWTAGKLIANNTILITLLIRTNQLVGEILKAAGGIAGGAARIEAHAAKCSGCPNCVVAHTAAAKPLLWGKP